MKVCKYCNTENRNELLICEKCGRYLLAPNPETQSLKPKQQRASVMPTKPANAKKPRKPTEYVKLYHGPWVKKPT